MTASTVVRRPQSGSLAEIVDIILDKGLVIDAFVRVSLVGIELLTVDARIVVAGVDTYLHFAEAVDRLDIRGKAQEQDMTLKDLVSGMGQEGARAKTQGALEGAGNAGRGLLDNSKDRIRSAFGDGEAEREDAGARRSEGEDS